MQKEEYFKKLGDFNSKNDSIFFMVFQYIFSFFPMFAPMN